ncbi:unnamed protein product [Phytomonas sp. Hart1]|nr:unnamed protein product [Phytomonas sp. Hart1]|eukprot:CCW68578.1 unnamed protein product [Phytomonas sp. isolate Hart1]
MVSLISHSPKPVATNFYENSFKQLSDIQQKQVGLIVGASVADAAARALEGFSADEILALENRDESDSISSVSKSNLYEESSVVFSDIQEENFRGDLALSEEGLLELRQQRGRNPLFDHSFSYMLFFALLRTMSAARGEFPVSFVEPLWIKASHRVHPTLVFAQHHGSFLHTLCTLLSIPTIYPYASDEALRAYVDPFIDSLTTPPPSYSSDLEGNVDDFDELAHAEREAVRNFTKSALGVVLRVLQSIPDPERNAAFMAIPGTADIFTPTNAVFCPPLGKDSLNTGSDGTNNINTHNISLDKFRRWKELRQERLDLYRARASLPTASFAEEKEVCIFPARPTLYDAGIVREAFTIARMSRSFMEGVVRAVQAGGEQTSRRKDGGGSGSVICHRTMLVGALLGGRFGIRRIPTSWINATIDYKPLITMAIEVAQWAWNPPHH